MWSVILAALGPMPGPAGLISTLQEADPSAFRTIVASEKTPPKSKYGAPKPTVPVNGEPSLILIVAVATTVPFGAVSGSVGATGATVITGTGTDGAATVIVRFAETAA